MLLDLVSEWTGMMQASAAKSKMAEIKEQIGETCFAWSGPIEKGGAAYFRVQGPTVIIEVRAAKAGRRCDQTYPHHLSGCYK